MGFPRKQLVQRAVRCSLGKESRNSTSLGFAPYVKPQVRALKLDDPDEKARASASGFKAVGFGFGVQTLQTMTTCA